MSESVRWAPKILAGVCLSHGPPIAKRLDPAGWSVFPLLGGALTPSTFLPLSWCHDSRYSLGSFSLWQGQQSRVQPHGLSSAPPPASPLQRPHPQALACSEGSVAQSFPLSHLLFPLPGMPLSPCEVRDRSLSLLPLLLSLAAVASRKSVPRLCLPLAYESAFSKPLHYSTFHAV